MKIGISCDHAGFPYLDEVKKFIESLGYECQSFGPSKLNIDDDYPDYIDPLAGKVSAGELEMAVIMGGSGQGEAMVANRHTSVRCAVFYGPVRPNLSIDADGKKSDDPYEIIKLSRRHNNSNILSLGVRFMDLEQIKQAIKIWITTDFSGDQRHSRRIAKIDGVA